MRVLDASWITGNLWVGATPERGHFGRAFDVFVLVALEAQPSSADLPGVRIRRLPFDDAEVPSRADVAQAFQAADLVARDLRLGRRVLVACRMGRNRSGLVAALALVRLGYSPARALDLVRTQRVDRTGTRALSNPAFRELVLRARSARAMERAR